jgi:hypothetical protein
MGFVNCDRRMVASIDDEFIPVDWRFNAVFAENVPEFLNKRCDSLSQWRWSSVVEDEIAVEFDGIGCC